MPKVKYDHIAFIPKAFNFSEVTPVTEDTEVDFEVSDLGSECQRLEAQLDTETNILKVLNFLTDREKIVFLYQLIREDGYGIDHVACAQTLHIKRSYYMTMLNKVKTKAKFILAKYKQG